MCCFITALLLAGPRLAILVWWIFSPLYITSIFQTWIWPILGWIFLPWTTLMYMSIAPGGIIGFDWILLGLGIFADMASYFGGYAERQRIPYGDRIPSY
ncbi:MAG: hypothetical protein ACK2UU_12760 [Anaerolineae bacterium]|jgi:hypothetical protein